MKYISLWQPWARAMMPPYSLKTIETRGWSTNYRGPVAIHVAKRESRRQEIEVLLSIARDLDIRIERPPVPRHEPGSVGDRLQGLYDGLGVGQRGAIIGVGDLVAVHCADCIAPELSDLELAFGDYSAGRFGLQFESVRVISPIPFKARQGKLIDLPDVVAAQVMEAAA